MNEAAPEKLQEFRERLLAWYKTGRRRFSWRNGRRSAYEILIAEMMLRKTDAAKVQQLYDDFLQWYPHPEELAAADEAKLRVEIRLLGIADRARLLRLTARKLVDEHGGRVPASAEALLELPGVGRYTANAVLCFAYRQDAPLLDTNVIRIVERVFSVSSERARPHEDPKLWEFALALVPPGRAAAFNRALLDFAATLCTAAKPRCVICPMSGICDYHQEQLAQQGSDDTLNATSSDSAVCG